MTTVPVTLPLPPGVSISWSSTGAQCVIWCSNCRSGTALYSTVLLRDVLALDRAITDHRECKSPEAPAA